MPYHKLGPALTVMSVLIGKKTMFLGYNNNNKQHIEFCPNHVPPCLTFHLWHTCFSIWTPGMFHCQAGFSEGTQMGTTFFTRTSACLSLMKAKYGCPKTVDIWYILVLYTETWTIMMIDHVMEWWNEVPQSWDNSPFRKCISPFKPIYILYKYLNNWFHVQSQPNRM